MRRLAVLAGLLFAAAAAAEDVALAPAQLDALRALAVGDHVALAEVPDGSGGRVALELRRIDVYAADARVLAVDAGGERTLARSARRELVGADASGRVRVALAFDADLGRFTGVGASASGAFVLSLERGAGDARLRVVPAAAALPPGVTPQVVAGDDALPGAGTGASALAIALTPHAPDGALRAAVVAVDTDNEFMSARFGNDTAAATDWIADLFGAMNVMYERDLGVELQQGTTYLRTSADPYAQTGSPANQAELQEFGDYWQAHYGTVARAFAMLLSGKSSNPDSASGIAWIDAYCRTQSQGGSYSVSQVFTDSRVGVGYSALIVGHELGHNFGAYHTHCTDVSTGDAPTASNTIDRCYNESGCYSGPTSCPSSGPGAPAGTVMSYCNTIGCGPNGQNVLQFHPTQIGVLTALVAQNTPSCLRVSVDEIFGNGFD